MGHGFVGCVERKRNASAPRGAADALRLRLHASYGCFGFLVFWFFGLLVLWFVGCSGFWCWLMGEEAKAPLGARLRRMRGAKAQRIGSEGAWLMRYGFASTHPTGACSICQLSLRSFRPARTLRATKKPTNQQTNKRSASCYRLRVGAADALRLRLHAAYGSFGLLVLWFFGLLVARASGAGWWGKRLRRHFRHGFVGCVERQRNASAPGGHGRCVTASPPRILRVPARYAGLASDPSGQPRIASNRKTNEPTNQKTQRQLLPGFAGCVERKRNASACWGCGCGGCLITLLSGFWRNGLMTGYRRAFVPGGTFFFTVNLLDRRSGLLVKRVDRLRAAVCSVMRERPFEIHAWVVLPDHLHALWTLPPGDADFSTRWRLIKSRFSRQLAGFRADSGSRSARGERAVWQRRFWEHVIRDERDFERHMDYIHFNPVKHGHVTQVGQWPYSTFHRCVEAGLYPPEWAYVAGESEGGFGERDEFRKRR